MDQHITRQLHHVIRRLVRLRRWWALSWVWSLVALCAAVLNMLLPAGSTAVNAANGLLAVGAVLSLWFFLPRRMSERQRLETARLIEQRWPSLEQRLLTVIEQQPDLSRSGFTYLQDELASQVRSHAYVNDWKEAVPQRRVVGKIVTAMIAVLLSVYLTGHIRTEAAPILAEIEEERSEESVESLAEKFNVTIVPGNAEVERGTALLITATFEGRLPSAVTLKQSGLTDQSDEETDPETTRTMRQSLKDPLFGTRLASVDAPFSYYVQYDDETSEVFEVAVYELLRVEQVDARIEFPSYSDLADELIEDTWRVSTVEGSSVVLTVRLNKEIAKGHLVDREGEEFRLTPAERPAANPDQSRFSYQTRIPVDRTRRLSFKMQDDRGRNNRDEDEFVVTAIPNRPPEIKLTFPGRDLRVSPIEELQLEATIWDDFGIDEHGLVLDLADREPKIVTLGDKASGRKKHELAHLLALELEQAEPDQLVSYYFFADDRGPSGEKRRTMSDLFFAEVRHFEEIFREGQAPPSGPPSQGKNAQKAEELAKLQKQIINATWKVIRREIRREVSDAFTPDVELLIESQQAALEQLGALMEELKDPQSKKIAEHIATVMNQAIERLSQANQEQSTDQLTPALKAERAASQGLLKLRAREHTVTQQQPSQSSSSSSNSSSQQQLDQLELDNKKNRYETEKQAGNPQQEQQNREQLQILNRLRELARRQGDLNQKLRELELELKAAETEEEREEIERQLKRLREEQRELLRDVDELKERMEKPENQQQMAESKEKLEDTRSKVRQASDALEKGQLSQALNSGTRAERELQELRDEVRQQAAGQFGDEMRDLRQQAREIGERQDEIAQALNKEKKPEGRKRSLRSETEETTDLRTAFEDQREQLDRVMEQMREVVEKAETAEPLLARQLYETVRKARSDRLEDALNETDALTRRGLVKDAANVERQAHQGLDRLQTGIERAAESVLGNELETLKRARRELDQAGEAVKRELAQADPGELQKMQRARGNSEPGKRGSEQPDQDQPGTPQDNQPGNKPGDADSKQESQSTSGKGSQPGQLPNDPKADQQKGPGGQKPGDQESKDQQSGKQPSQGQKGDQPTDSKQPSESKEKGDSQSQGKQPGKGEGQQQSNSPSKQSRGKQPGQQPSSGKRSEGQGLPPEFRPPSGQKPSSQSQSQSGQPSPGQSSKGQPGNKASDSQSSSQSPSQSSQGKGSSQSGQRQQPGLRPRQNQSRQPNPQRSATAQENGGNSIGPGAPLTGPGFVQWSDQMRNIEELVEDPELRAEIARVREAARSMRAEFKRHSKEPEWSLVRMKILEPLDEIRDRLREEIARRESPDSLVPIDRDPVPEKYADLVRRYYERIGSGK